MKHWWTSLLLLLSLHLMAQDSLPLNHFRILASHNSYKKWPSEQEMRFLYKIRKQLGEENNPDMINYGHATLEDQLSLHQIRGLEFDVYADPKGKAFRKRQIGFFARGVKKKCKEPLLSQPGLKILHIKDIDFETHVFTFEQALLQLRSWSVNHPNHFPIYVNIELKEDGPGNSSRALQRLGFKKAPLFDSVAWSELNATIAHTLADRIVTPLDMQGDYADLRQRIDSLNWPKLQDVRGKFIFIVEGFNQDLRDIYWSNPTDFPVFGYGEEQNRNCVFLLRNDPMHNETAIQDLVRRGYVVRTRTDAGTWEARRNDSSRKFAAFQGMAQIVSTDYYLPNLNWSAYYVKLTNGLDHELLEIHK
ncbi:MAG: hypothetical protein RIR06_1518 [Bacteroidota bacterium]